MRTSATGAQAMDIAETTDPEPKVCYSSAKQAVVGIYYLTLLILHEFHATFVQQPRKSAGKPAAIAYYPDAGRSGKLSTGFSVRLAPH